MVGDRGTSARTVCGVSSPAKSENRTGRSEGANPALASASPVGHNEPGRRALPPVQRVRRTHAATHLGPCARARLLARGSCVQRPDHLSTGSPASGRSLRHPAGSAQPVLHHLPQPAAPHRRPRARHARRAQPGANAEVWERVIGKLRAGSMPPPGMPRPDAATYRAVATALERDIDRAWASQPESGPHRRRPPPQSHRIQQRRPRPVRARPRRQAAAARRRDGRRQLRQLRRRAVDLDGAPGAISVGGSSGHAARDRPSARQPGVATFEIPHARDAGRSAERGSAVRIARRHRHSPQLSRRRRVPHQGPAAAPVSGLPQGHGMAAAARRPSRWQAAEAVHRRRRRQGPASGAQLRRRRRAGLCRRSRVGKVHAGRRRRGPGGPRPGRGGPARRRRVVRQGDVGAGRPAAAAAARQGHHERQGRTWTTRTSARSRSAVRTRRSVRAKDTPSRRAIFVCQPQRSRGRASLRHHDPVADGPARLSAAGDAAPTCRRCSSSSTAAGARAEASTPASSSRSNGCWSTRTSCCASIAIRPPAAATIASSDLELASRLSFFLWSSIPDERLLDSGRARAALDVRRSWNSRCGGCWRTRARPTRSSTTSPRSG